MIVKVFRVGARIQDNSIASHAYRSASVIVLGIGRLIIWERRARGSSSGIKFVTNRAVTFVSSLQFRRRPLCPNHSTMSDLLEPKTNLSSSSPIRRLPLDVLHIIFDITRRDPPSAIPFTLSNVCHEWRSFLLASPLLWTTIVIASDPLPNPKYYDLWLERSQRLDLSLHIQTSSLALGDKDLDPFVQIICSLGSYCKGIEVPGIYSLLDIVFRAITLWLRHGQFPKLTKLSLPLTSAAIFTESELEAACMPNLWSLVIHGSLFRLSNKWLSACGGLRRLHLTYDDLVLPSTLLASLHRIIQSISSQIEDLNIHVPGHGELLAEAGFPGVRLQIVEIPGDIILLPKLTKLSLSWGKGNSGGCFFCDLFRVLHAPKLLALHNLSISTLVKEKVLNHHPLLERLGLTGHPQYEPAASQGILPSFKAVQLESLHSLRFDVITWQEGVFTTLLLQSCPQLVSVRLHQCTFVLETDLRRLVEGREASEELATLRYLGVLSCKALELSEEALAWFEGRLETFEFFL